jgi:hypothetical protein
MSCDNNKPESSLPVSPVKDTEDEACGCTCGPSATDPLTYRKTSTVGAVETAHGSIPIVTTTWNMRDRLGAIVARLSALRMNYAIASCR